MKKNSKLVTQMSDSLGDCEDFLNRLKGLEEYDSIGGADGTEAPVTLFERAAILISRGEPVCLLLQEHIAPYMVDPEVMGYYYGRTDDDFEYTIGFLEEMCEILTCMATNLRITHTRMKSLSKTCLAADPSKN